MKTRITATKNPQVFSLINKSFTVTYQYNEGQIMHGYVTQTALDEYEVFVREKEVIIRCKKDENGILCCQLGSKKNIPWVDGICSEISKTLFEQ